MKKKIGLVLAGFAAIAMIGYGSYALAGEGKSCSSTCSATCGQKATNTTSTSTAETTPAAMASDNAAPAVAGAECTPAQKAACAAQGKTCGVGSTCTTTGAKNASMTTAPAMSGCSASEQAKCASAGVSCSATCGSKGAKASYSANVYKVENGVKYAVADGKKFVVTANTPFTDVGSARYYFADESCAVKCPTAMSSMASKYNHEAAVLASNEANVKVMDGKKFASCCGQEFEVTSNTPVVCIDGQKSYCCSEKCAQSHLNKSL